MQNTHSFFVNGRLVYVPDADMDEFLAQNESAEEADVFTATNADGETREFTVPRSRAEEFAARAAQAGGSATRMRRVEMDDGETLTLGDGALRQLVQARKQGEVMSRGLLKSFGIPDAYARGRAEREALVDALGRMFPDEEAVDGLGAPQDNFGDKIVRGGNVVRDVVVGAAERAAEAARTSPAVAGAVGAAKGLYEGAMGNPVEAYEDFYGEGSLPAEMLKGAGDMANAFVKGGAQTLSYALGGNDTAAGRAVRGFADRLRTDTADLETGSETGNAIVKGANEFVQHTLPTLAKYAVPGVAATDIMGGVVDTYESAYARAVENGASPDKANALAAAEAGIGAAEGLWLAKSAAGGVSKGAIKAALGRVLGMAGKMGAAAGARSVVEQGVEGAENPDLLRAAKDAAAGAVEGGLFELAGMGVRGLADAPRRAAEAASAKRVGEAVAKQSREAEARARYESRLSDEAEADVNATVAKMVETGVIPSWRNTPEVTRRAREKIGGRGRGESHEAVEQAVMEAAQEVAEGLQSPARVSSAALERRQTEAESRRNEHWARRSEELAREYGAEEAARRLEAERRAEEGERAQEAADAEGRAARQEDLDAAFGAPDARLDANPKPPEVAAEPPPNPNREGSDSPRAEAPSAPKADAEAARRAEIDAMRQDPVLQRIDGQYRRAKTDAERAALKDAFAARVAEIRRGAEGQKPAERPADAQTPPVSKTETTAAKTETPVPETEIPVRGTETNVRGGETPEPKRSEVRRAVIDEGRRSVMASPNAKSYSTGKAGMEKVVYTPKDGGKPFTVGRNAFEHSLRGANAEDNAVVGRRLGEALDASAPVGERSENATFRIAPVRVNGEDAHVLFTVVDGKMTDFDVLKGYNTKKNPEGMMSEVGGADAAKAFEVRADSIANLDRAWQERFKPGLVEHAKRKGGSLKFTAAARAEEARARGGGGASEGVGGTVDDIIELAGRYSMCMDLPQNNAKARASVKAAKSALESRLAGLSDADFDYVRENAPRAASGKDWMTSRDLTTLSNALLAATKRRNAAPVAEEKPARAAATASNERAREQEASMLKDVQSRSKSRVKPAYSATDENIENRIDEISSYAKIPKARTDLAEELEALTAIRAARIKRGDWNPGAEAGLPAKTQVSDDRMAYGPARAAAPETPPQGGAPLKDAVERLRKVRADKASTPESVAEADAAVEAARAPDRPFDPPRPHPDAKAAAKVVGEFAGKDKDRPSLHGTYHDKANGVVVATDGRILIATRHGFDPNAADREYPNWKQVVPADKDLTRRAEVNPSALAKACAEAARLTRATGAKDPDYNRAKVALRIGDRVEVFDAELLGKVARAMEANGITEIRATGKGNNAVAAAKNGDTTIALMPLRRDIDGTIDGILGKAGRHADNQAIVISGESGRVLSAPERTDVDLLGRERLEATKTGRAARHRENVDFAKGTPVYGMIARARTSGETDAAKVYGPKWDKLSAESREAFEKALRAKTDAEALDILADYRDAISPKTAETRRHEDLTIKRAERRIAAEDALESLVMRRADAEAYLGRKAQGEPETPPESPKPPKRLDPKAGGSSRAAKGKADPRAAETLKALAPDGAAEGGGEARYAVVRRATVGVKDAMRRIADGGSSGVVHNAEYGDIEYPLGRTGKRGMGLAHIVESRMAKDGATLDEAIDVAIKVASAAESGKVTSERYNTKHLDKDGVRAIVAFMPDGSRVITGYEISADRPGGANRRSPDLKSPPHVSLEEIVAALKDKLSFSDGIVPQNGLGAQGGGSKEKAARLNLEEETDSQLKPQGRSGSIKTPEDVSTDISVGNVPKSAVDVNGGGGRLDMARLDPKRRSDPKVLAWARKQGRTVADGKVTPDAVREYDAQQAKSAAKAAKNWFPDLKTVYHDYGEGVERGQHVIDMRDTSGKAFGWFDPAKKEVHLLPGADAKTVAHEVMWHGTRDWAKRAAAQGDARAAALLAKMRDVESHAPEVLKRLVRWLYRKNGVADADTLSNEYGAWATMGRGGEALERAMAKEENRAWFAREFAAAKGLVREFLAKNGGNRADLSRIDGMGRDKFVEYVADRFAGGKTLGEIGAPKGAGRAVSTKETLWQKYRRKVYDVNSSIRDLQRAIEKKTGRRLTEDEDVEMANALSPGLREAAVMSVRSKLRQYRELLHRHGLADADVQYYMALKAAAGRDAKVDARNIAEIRAEVERGLRREWGTERVRTEKEAFKAELARRQADAVADYRSTNGSHVDPREARAMLAEIEGGEKADDYAAARKFLRGLMDETLDAQERSGLVSKESAARFRADEPDYVPFKNEFDADTGEFVGRGSREFLRPEHFAAKGRKTAAGDVTAHIFGDYQSTLLRGVETDVRQKLAALVRANPELGTVERVGEGERPKEKRSSDAKDPKNLTGDPNLVLFKEGGDTYAIRLEGTRGSAVAAAITERNVKRLDGAFAKFARFQAGMATRWSLTFPQRNLTKDNIELANIVFSEKGLVKGTKWMKAYAAGQAKNAAALAKYVATGNIDEATEAGRTLKAYIDAGGLISGGATEGYADIKSSLTPEAIEREISRGSSTARAAGKHLLHSLAYVNEYAELATRVNAFAAERALGASDRAAALFARRATVDFNRHGENTGVTNVVRLFSNSTLGADARAVAALGASKYGRRVAAALFANGFAQAVVEEFLNRDEDRKRGADGLATGKDVSEFDRKTSLLHLRVGDKYYKVAQHESPFALCGYAGDLVARAMMGKVGWGDAAKRLGVSAAELAYHFTGLGSVNLGSRSGTVGDDIKAAAVSGLVPSALQPFAEVATGIDYKGDPLYRRNYSETTPNSEVAKKSTPEWAVRAARLLNWVSGGSAARKGYVDVHPEAVQKVVEGLGKNAAKDVMNLYEVGNAILDRDWGRLDDRNKPFKRDYVKPLDGNTARFFEAYEEYRKDKAEFEGLRAEWTPEKRRAYLDAHPWLRLSPSGKRRVDSLVEAKNRTTPRSGVLAMGINQLRKLADGLVLQKDGRYAEPGVPVPDAVKERAKRELLKKQALVLEAMGRQ